VPPPVFGCRHPTPRANGPAWLPARRYSPSSPRFPRAPTAHAFDRLELLALDDSRSRHDFFGLVAHDRFLPRRLNGPWAAPAANRFIQSPISSEKPIAGLGHLGVSGRLHTVRSIQTMASDRALQEAELPQNGRSPWHVPVFLEKQAYRCQWQRARNRASKAAPQIDQQIEIPTKTATLPRTFITPVRRADLLMCLGALII